jgi:phosphoribosylformimino-5-aminoimidazole carboxamide ribotide isomerase
VKLAQALLIPVIASGGLSSIDDIQRLCAVEQEGISAAIAGRAIYDGSLDFAVAQAAADRARQIREPRRPVGQVQRGS